VLRLSVNTATSSARYTTTTKKKHLPQ